MYSSSHLIIATTVSSNTSLDQRPSGYPGRWTSLGYHIADAITNDSRNWPDPTEPRPSKPPVPKGCTCRDGDQGIFKLDCPVHGLNSTEDVNSWAYAPDQAGPVGFPQDAPKSWQQAYK